jgi:hypothetical protein
MGPQVQVHQLKPAPVYASQRPHGQPNYQWDFFRFGKKQARSCVLEKTVGKHLTGKRVRKQMDEPKVVELGLAMTTMFFE